MGVIRICSAGKPYAPSDEGTARTGRNAQVKNQRLILKLRGGSRLRGSTGDLVDAEESWGVCQSLE